MYQGTAPVIALEVPGVDLSDKQVTITIKTVTGEVIEKTNKDVAISGSEIGVYLTQAETLQIPEQGPCRVQVRWVGADGLPGNTSMGYFDVDGIMNKSIIGGENT